jgi:YVTN family beta-propeller protein
MGRISRGSGGSPRHVLVVLAGLAVPALALLVAFAGSSAGQSWGPNDPNPPFGLFSDDSHPSRRPDPSANQPGKGGGPLARGPQAESSQLASVSLAAAADAAVPVGTMPTGVATNDTRAYVANAQSNNVSVIDLTTAPQSVIATIPVGAFPVGVALSADSSQLYVTNYNANTLSIISTATNAVTHTVPVGSRANGVIRVGPSVYVANLTGNSISIVNPATGTVTGTISLTGPPARYPSALATNAAGNRLYASDAKNARLIVINLAVNPPVVLSDTTAVGTFPAYISVTNGTGYVANPGSNSVSVVNLAANPPTVSATVTGFSADYGIVAQPSLDQVFVTNSGSNNLSVVKMSTNTVVGTFPTGVKPNAIVLTPDGTTAVLSNQGDNTVSVLHVNQKPVNTVPGAQTVNANGTGSANKLTFSLGNGNATSITDTDAGTNPVKLTLTVNDGILTLSTTGGLNFNSGGNGTASMTLTGTVADVNAALAGMTYTPSTGFHGASTLTVTVDDQGNTGIGQAQSDTDTVMINVINVAPVVGAVGPFNGAVGNTIFGVGTTPAQPSTSTAGNVLSNSTDPNNDPLTAVAGMITTANGGTVNMNANGTFTYITAPGGATGNDTFTFQVSDGITTSSGTATVNVANRVWYINNTLGVNGNGTSISPFNTLANLRGADLDVPGDIIFLYSSPTSYTGGLPLEDNQKLTGQPEGLVVGAVTLLPAAGTNPTITNGAGNGVTLAQSNTIRRVNVTGASGAAIGGTSIGNADIGPSLTLSGSGNEVNLAGAASGTITVAATISHSGANPSVAVSNRSGGTVTFSGALTDTAGGVLLQNNGGTTLSFTGGVTVTDTGSDGSFVATGGGTVNVAGDNNTLNHPSGSGTALRVENTTIGGSGLKFKSISANGGQNGIVLVDTGAGALTVTGDGATANSGGVIQNMTTGADGTNTGIGVRLSNAQNVSLKFMNLHDFSNWAIRGTNVANFTFENSKIAGSNGTTNALDEGSISFDELTGSASIKNTTIEGAVEYNLRVKNTGGTLNRLTVDTVTIGANSTALGDDGIQLEGTGGTFNATVNKTTFTSAAGDLFNLTVQGTATSDLVFTNNTLSNNHPNISGGGGGVTIAVGESGDMTYNIDNNTFRDSKGTALVVGKRFGAAPADGTMSGKIQNNTIGVSGVANSGSREGSGIEVSLLARGFHTSLIKNNKIYRYSNFGINVEAGGASQSVTGVTHDGDLNVTIQGNIIAQPNAPAGGLAQHGIHLNSGTNSTGGNDNYDVCLAIGDPSDATKKNTLTGSSALGGNDYRLRQRFDTDVRLPGYTGPANSSAGDTNAGLTSYLTPRTNGAFTLSSASTASGGFFNTAGGAACPLPA